MKTILPLLFALSVPAAAGTTIHVPGDQPTIQAAIEVAVNGEGPATLIEGFTITGANDVLFGGAAAIACLALHPTIRNCRLVDIQGGPGLFGDATIEDCVITGNQNLPYDEGGGIRGTWGGSMTIRRCTISNNRSGGLGGGIFLDGPSLVEDCLIQGNISGNGYDEYTGGGVFGPAILVRCVITDNTAHHWISGGTLDEIGSGVDGAVSIDRCTIAFNMIANSDGFPVKPGGGVKDVGTITNSIIWGNEDAEFSASTMPVVTHTTVLGGYPGTGNQTADPLFLDAAAGDYFLQLGSPAIDKGDPAATFDPDGTVADMGGLYFPQFPAAVAVRNGTGVNPLCYVSTVDPVLGTTWNRDLRRASARRLLPRRPDRVRPVGRRRRRARPVQRPRRDVGIGAAPREKLRYPPALSVLSGRPFLKAPP